MDVPPLNSPLLNGFPILLFYETTRPERGPVWSSRSLLCLFGSNPIHFLCIYWPAVMRTSALTGIEEPAKTNATASVFTIIVADITGLSRFVCLASLQVVPSIRSSFVKIKRVFIRVNKHESRGILLGDDGCTSLMTDPDGATLSVLDSVAPTYPPKNLSPETARIPQLSSATPYLNHTLPMFIMLTARRAPQMKTRGGLR